MRVKRFVAIYVPGGTFHVWDRLEGRCVLSGLTAGEAARWAAEYNTVNRKG